MASMSRLSVDSDDLRMSARIQTLIARRQSDLESVPYAFMGR